MVKRYLSAAIAALSLAAAAIFAIPAAFAADAVVYAPTATSAWTAVARDMNLSNCQKFGSDAAAYTYQSYPPGAAESGWLGVPSATAWGQYCNKALQSGGIGIGIYVAGDGKSFGAAQGYMIARLGAPGQFELLVSEAAPYSDGALAVLKARAAAKGGQVGSYVTTFVPVP